VKKERGSMFAYVTDRETDETIKRYDVFKGHGKLNGWNMADEHARRLNAALVPVEKEPK
jgi:hypothetical protein